MSMTKRVTGTMALGLTLCLSAGAAAPSPARAAQPAVKAEQFEQLHKMIKPTAAETKWTQIPWMTELWDARQRAAREGKPILLWEMDGHPMGCV